MKRSVHITLIILLFCLAHTTTWAQIIRKQVVVSFANAENPIEKVAMARSFAASNRLTISDLDKLSCIPYTFLWELTGTLGDIIATVDYIKGRPHGCSDNDENGTGSSPTAPTAAPPPCAISQDSLNAYSSCESRGGRGVLMSVIDDGIGDVFGSTQQRINYKTFFQPYLWSNPTAAGSVGYSFLNNNPSPIAGNAQHGSAVTFRIVDMLRKARVSNVKIMILQTHNPETHLGTVWNVCRALDFSYCNNVNIVNLSLAGVLGNTNPERMEEAGTSALEVIIQYMGTTKNILIVAAAGNDGANVTLPRLDNKRYCTASYQLPNLIEVAANARCSDTLWGRSNRGAPNVHLSAPGQSVYCAVPVTVNPSGIAALTGTSLAAPHVAAAAAILGVNRLTSEFKYLPIAKSLSSAVTPVRNLAGVVSSGGRLNTCQALKFFWQNYPAGFAAQIPQNTEGSPNPQIGASALTIAPNPVLSNVAITLTSEQDTEAELTVKNVLGRVQVQQKWGVFSGQNTLSLDASNFVKGVYFVHIQINKQFFVQKMIKND